MVTRASSVPHSINKINASRTRKATQTPPKQKDSTRVPRSRSLNNGIRQRSSGGSSSNDRSRNTPVFLRSRENEIGSADTLEIIASKSTGSEPSTPDDNINVVVRVRPLSEKEKRGTHEMILQFPGNGQVMIEGHGSGTKASRNRENVKVFTYNVVFEPGATQEDILDYSGIKRIIEMAIEGFSCTAFCYGQTGSGKTHTLTGPPELFAGKPNPKDRRHGLIFRSFLYLFQLIKNRKETHFILKASFLEIYNEKVIDLLNPGSARKPLSVRWSKKSGGFFVENLFTVDCEELDDLLAVLEEGMRNRATGCHQMNEHSSRSHTILTVHIISEQQADGNVFISKHGKINFVDLAGSELTKKTLSEGKTLEEANNINKSLMVLGYCIASLSDSRKRSGHIPYRDSQLTKLLADSLAGNGVTLMIACVSPSQYNYAETLNTLRYASRAKLIRTKPVIIMDPREALILSLKRDIHSLEMENEHLKTALNLHHETAMSADMAVATEPNVPKVDLERLAELDGSDLAELVKLYMQENETLRQENSHLCTIREIIMRDQEIVCRENERLLKKLEDVNKVCVRSPLITAQPALSSTSGSEGDTEIWTNPRDTDSPLNKGLVGRISENKDRISDEAQRVIDKKRIGKNILHMAENFRMYDSKKRQNETGYMPESHTILTVHIISEQQADGNVFISKHGKINFVDLAGSELTKKTLSEGKTLEEANNINKSLMVLGYCIASLSDSRKRSGHIPYRDSQLTKLLADSLAGNGVTLMIACVSPSQYNYAETLNTLRYASRAKLIRTKPVIIMDPREALILSLKRDIHSLEMENEHLKTALNLHHETAMSADMAVATEPNVPKVDLERLAELDGSDLAELVKLYMQENETLRQENSHLCTIREIIMRDQEIVCRENERLLKKLEDVNKVCVRSPLITAQPALSSTSGSEGDTEIWTNPRDTDSPLNKGLVGRISENKDRISDEAQRVIDKKRIGKNILHMAENFRMYDSKKRQNETGYMPDMLV